MFLPKQKYERSATMKKKGLAILAVLISAVSAVVFFRKKSHC